MISFMQNLQQKKDDQGQTQPRSRRERPVDNTHISPIAGFICALAFLAAIIGANILSSAGVGENPIAAWVILLMLFGLYILFALKVAQQWEKAVVLRLGKFHALR